MSVFNTGGAKLQIWILPLYTFVHLCRLLCTFLAFLAFSSALFVVLTMNMTCIYATCDANAERYDFISERYDSNAERYDSISERYDSISERYDFIYGTYECCLWATRQDYL